MRESELYVNPIQPDSRGARSSSTLRHTHHTKAFQAARKRSLEIDRAIQIACVASPTACQRAGAVSNTDVVLK